jgi:hypothetical protein
VGVVKCSAVKGVNRGVVQRVFTGGVVKRSEDHVKIGVQYLWSSSIRN